MRSLILLAVFISVTTAETEPRAAFLHPSISAQEICLNQLVQVTFVTLKPQVDGVDATQVIQTALALPSVAKHWRVVGKPKIIIDEKIKTLKVSYQLLPRHFGDLDLPEIPVKWLPGNSVGRMGEVTVLAEIRMGPETRPVPEEMTGVGGFAWGTSFDDVLKATGLKTGTVDATTGAMVISPKQGLDLIFQEQVFGTARLHVPDMPLARARQAFLERWGDPIGEVTTDHGTVITWMFGWIRVEAHGLGEGTVLYIVHEEIENRLNRAAVEQKVFNVLDGGASTTTTVPATTNEDPVPAVNPVTEKKVPVPPPTTIPVPDKKVELQDEDFERELDRLMRERNTAPTP